VSASTSTSRTRASTAAAAARPLRLLQVLGNAAGAAGETSGITGVERVVQLLLEGLDKSRFEHYVAYPLGGVLMARYRDTSRAILALAPRRRYDPAYVRALAGFARAHAVDIVLSHGLRVDFLAEIACRSAAVPHLVSRAVALADEPMPRLQRALYGLADSWTLGRCRGIVAVSEASKRRMCDTQHLPDGKIAVIPNGVRLAPVPEEERQAARRALGVEPHQLLVGGIGQLITRKSFDVLVRAVAALAPMHPRLACVVLGEGPERAHLQALSRELGVELLLPGFCADPYPALAGFDVAVLPSRAEGMPLVILESMALGVPTVATAVAGTVEVIEDGVSGVLVPPGDAPALAAALGPLLQDETLRRRLGAAGARRVEARYSLDAMLRAFAAYLRRAAGWEAA